jgi:hypothetical protein
VWRLDVALHGRMLRRSVLPFSFAFAHSMARVASLSMKRSVSRTRSEKMRCFIPLGECPACKLCDVARGQRPGLCVGCAFDASKKVFKKGPLSFGSSPKDSNPRSLSHRSARPPPPRAPRVLPALSAPLPLTPAPPGSLRSGSGSGSGDARRCGDSTWRCCEQPTECIEKTAKCCCPCCFK